MPKKSVRWSTVTVYEFGVAIGGSAVPKRGGPAVGLAKRPALVWHTTVDAVRCAPLRDVGPSGCCAAAATPERAASPASACASACASAPSSPPAGRVTAVSRTSSSEGEEGGASPSRRCRQRRVRWLKPLERVAMLERAGYSEKRIYRMLMESSQIAMSRRLSLRLPAESGSPVRAA